MQQMQMQNCRTEKVCLKKFLSEGKKIGFNKTYAYCIVKKKSNYYDFESSLPHDNGHKSAFC